MDAALHSETLVQRTAQELRRLSLAMADGAFIGSEVDLRDRLGVSRPTLRQAAKIAENDRLISIKRGLRGGFYASRPEAADAVQTLARYLRINGASMADILVVSRLIAEEAAGRAAQCRDVELKRELARFVRKIGEADSPAALIAAETRLARLVADMSGNAAIKLVMAIGYSYGLDEQDTGLYHDVEQRVLIRKLQRALCRAILDEDVELARLMMRRRSDTISKWLAGNPNSSPKGS